MFATTPSYTASGKQMLRLALIVGLSAGVAACGKKAPDGQTVATVNGEAITQSELNVEMAASGVTAQNRTVAQPQVLQSMINRKLIVQQATKDGVDKSPDFVLAERRAREILLAQRAVQSAAAGMSQPPSEGDINAYLDKHPGLGEQRRILELDQVKFQAPRSAEEAKAYGPIKTMDELVALLSTRGVQMERSRVQADTATLPEDVLAKLRAMRNGEPLVIVQGPVAIANVVVGERPNPSGSMQAADMAKQRIVNERLVTTMRQRQDSLRKEAKIDYAAGFAPKPAAAAATR